MSIDDLLAQPLPAVSDNGFSARVMSHIRAEQRERAVLISTGSALAATAACFVLPMPALSSQLGDVMVSLLTSPVVALGAAALILTFLVDRRILSL